MDLDLLKILKGSNINEADYKEVSKILTRLLNEKYNKEVVIEKLLSQAKFDRDVFYGYWKKKQKESGIGCYQISRDKANEFGFDRNYQFGSLAVTFIDFFFDNYKQKDY